MKAKKITLENEKRETTTVLGHSSLGVVLPVPMLDFSRNNGTKPTVVFRSESVGEGNPVLGDQLMTEFFQALIDNQESPQALLFYNSAIHLTLEDSRVIEQIRRLAARHCEVLVCKTSLEIEAPGQQPAVGRTAPMAELVDRMRQARRLLWP